ncbi:carcinoembryonic antigen-related cell adhesion molecule 20-like isoform X2 [Carassius carassius]|uniref:carcinoembryonic antigen-related cell adhesion molecule 20-like isoform X2 n=1 Tax=Carassius carassius TaxID=217509 RepID=UPI0028694491|nr:carcinoembryonic antigen-related cell adhesion molecule 20-like isoform X2 [Carassius carassius]
MMVSCGLYGTLWILSCFGLFLSEDLQISGPTNGAVGGSVVFAPVNPPSTSIIAVLWNFGSTLILTGPPDSPTIASAYRDRASFDRNTFSLELWNLRLEDSGIYRLTVLNTAGDTLTGETSLVFENITNVRVIGPEESLIEGKSSANFSSEGTGIITSVQWMKDNSPLSPSNSIIFSSDNRSVSISPVQRSDSGEYQCTYRNPASSEMAKPVHLIINYGPEDVSVKGEDVVDLGVRVSLSCSANSEPSASFSWKFNETDTNVTTDTFTINETDFTHSGDYICTASNNVTKRNASHKHALLVKEGGAGGGGGGLSSGAIAGIVIGVLVAVAGICGLTVYLTKTKKIPKINLGQHGPARGAAQSRQEPDLNYADISHFQKASGERVNLGNKSEFSTEYAEVKPGGKSRAPPPPYGHQSRIKPSCAQVRT